MPNKFLWHDAEIDKPTTTDPVLCLTSKGLIVIAQYDYRRFDGKWYELQSDEHFDDVVWWSDFSLPRGHKWKMSDLYDIEE